MKNMNKDQYIEKITELLKECRKENTLYFICGLLERLIASGEPG